MSESTALALLDPDEDEIVTAQRAAGGGGRKRQTGITLTEVQLSEIRKNADAWKAGDTVALGDYIRTKGLEVLQILPIIAMQTAGHRSANNQRVSAAKSFIQMSSELVKILDALEEHSAKRRKA